MLIKPFSLFDVALREECVTVSELDGERVLVRTTAGTMKRIALYDVWDCELLNEVGVA